MADNLKKYFPLIREREEIRQIIQENRYLSEEFHVWNQAQQEKFLDMCSGSRGIKMLYDSFFKEIMNPEYNSERLNEFLSLLLNRRVKIQAILPNDSTRVTDESSLLITDIVVELEDGSLANVEIQKVGYLFPGQRCACYSSDLLLRQYRRIRDAKKKKFSYKDIKSVYVVVLFEQSTKEFWDFPETYYHFFEQKSNTGLEMEFLQKYVCVPLDIFRKNLHNKGIKNKREAWLAFLCEDDPEIIIELIENWPEFRTIYEEIYDLCRNIEGVMRMFSKELLELDRNTVQYMIDEMHETIERQKKELEQTQEAIYKAKAEKQKAEAEKQQAEAEKQKAEAEKQQAETEKQKAKAEKKWAEEERDMEKQRLEAACQRIEELERLLRQKQL